jgi:hypothetical protein
VQKRDKEEKENTFTTTKKQINAQLHFLAKQ